MMTAARASKPRSEGFNFFRGGGVVGADDDIAKNARTSEARLLVEYLGCLNYRTADIGDGMVEHIIMSKWAER